MKVTPYVKMRNLPYSGYSCCSRCGGNWGWKKWISHKTSESEGLCLFCTRCDKVVTVEERWKALDDWKGLAIKSILAYVGRSIEGKLEGIRKILDTEFVEFPRGSL